MHLTELIHTNLIDHIPIVRPPNFQIRTSAAPATCFEPAPPVLRLTVQFAADMGLGGFEPPTSAL